MRVELTLSKQAAARLGAAGWREAVACGTPWAPNYRLQEPPAEIGLEEVEGRRYPSKRRAEASYPKRYVAEMAEVVAAEAAERGWLLREPLATSEEVNAYPCPLHGDEPCREEEAGYLMRWGCLERQLAVLRVAPRSPASEGLHENP